MTALPIVATPHCGVQRTLIGGHPSSRSQQPASQPASQRASNIPLWVAQQFGTSAVAYRRADGRADGPPMAGGGQTDGRGWRSVASAPPLPSSSP